MIWLTMVGNDTGDAEFDAKVAERQTEFINEKGVVWDGEAGEVREWAEGDDENDAVHAITFKVLPPDHRTMYDTTWRDSNLTAFSFELDERSFLDEITQEAFEKASELA